jgi:hypothetical protein
MGPQVGPPFLLELTTSAANATLPLKPISQASIFSGLAVPYSAGPAYATEVSKYRMFPARTAS